MMLAEYTQEEIAATLDGVAAGLLHEAGVAGPPIDAIGLARALGISVVMDDRQAGRARFVRLEANLSGMSRPTIAIAPDPRPERRHWAVAHEIGEHVTERIFREMGVDPRVAPPTAREQAANQLAGRLLVPTDWLTRLGRQTDWDLPRLKMFFTSASHELIARRMLECRPAITVRIFDQARLTFARSNVHGRVPVLSATEARCWRMAHETNRPHSGNDDDLSAICWPIHEPDWRREIIRTEHRGFEM